ncbi:putative mediator of RNA polymerase II transcription subunit 26 [Macrobrachium nipponense]|uniref:putative mediator of RNA polymerase II transcription subunit 26 n=1 Tax=Macrobrachium nipponense TaxID=159736 RepID=UPI0030C814E7
MKVSMLIALIGSISVISAAPQFDFNNNQPSTPYTFAYGVNSPETGDVKEHKESVSPAGITEGEYRWLQPNGLFRVTRYTADNGGYRAVVSEEAGEPVATYYTNTLLGSGPSQGSVTTSFQSNNQGFSNFQPGNLVISRTQNFQDQSFTNSPNFQNQEFRDFQFQGFRNPQNIFPRDSGNGQSFQNQGFSGSQVFQNQRNVIDGGFQNQRNVIGGGFQNQRDVIDGGFQSQRNVIDGSFQNQRNLIDGGFQNQRNVIDGGFQNQRNVIDGGIINGGIIDGGVTSTTSNTFGSGFNRFGSNQNNFINRNFNGNFDSFNNFNGFGNSGFTGGDINSGTAVVLSSNRNRFIA